MAAAVAARPPVKMKKPSGPTVQTNGIKSGQPPPSPSSATKRLPGQQPPPTPVSATSANGARPGRRPQRLTTRTGTTDSSAAGKRTMKEFPEPYISKQSHILKKYRRSPPSLKVHLHPTHFRFDQQDGSFSYRSEMRIFIEHLSKGTIPYDMVEEFRKAEVPFYDGWLIVKVVDHRTSTTSNNAAHGANDDGKPFSIHNYTPYITPSPYVPYPTKEQTGQKSPKPKQEPKDQNTPPARDSNGDVQMNGTTNASPKLAKLQPRMFTVALRPTVLSRHMDLVVDAMAPDPKTLNRKQSTANVNSRAPGSAAPQTPISGVPSTPATEKGPPFKKQKLRIDARDLLEFEARTVNATAVPIYLDPVDSFEDVENLLEQLKDPASDTHLPSPKSRKRTVAELAADDALAKQQESYMLIMDVRSTVNATGANAAAVETQAGGSSFQPRFESFNTLEGIKRDLAERKQREKDRQFHDDEARRAQQEVQNENNKKRLEAMRQRERQIQDQKAMQEAAHREALRQQALTARNQQAAAAAMQANQQGHASGIPPQMQNRIMAPGHTASPILRQGTPQHVASSPVINNMNQNAQHAVSPARPGSAVQHHPGVPMARGPSNQGPSRNGTPQIPHSTPGMRDSTPVMRQPTPSQHAMTQGSPHGSMMAQATMPQQTNGMQPHMTPQMEIQRRRAMQVQNFQAQQHAQQAMANGGNPQMTPQMIHMQAQQVAAQQQRAAMANTPQPVAQSPAQHHAQYKQDLAEQTKRQMQQLQQGQVQGSPAPNQMTAQAQNHMHAAQQQMMVRAIAQQQQQQQQQGGQMMPGQPQMQPGQQRPAMHPQTQQMFNSYVQRLLPGVMQRMAGKYNGNTSMLTQQDHAQAMNMARKMAQTEMNNRIRMQQQAQHGGQQAAMMGQGGQMPQNAAQMQAMMNHQQAQQAQQMQMAQMANAQQQMNGMQGQQQNPQQLNSMQAMASYQAQLQQMQRHAQQGQQQ